MENRGSEGLYTSSFIRWSQYDDVTFVRTIDYAGKRNAMESTTGLVEAIILDGKDRDRIGSTFLKTNHAVVCCSPELADTGSCSLGEVIIRRDPADPEWPRQIKTFFKGNKTEAKMSPETVVINKTGVYYLYFMICDPELDGTMIRGRTQMLWKDIGITQLHYHISLVIALGMCEMAVQYFEYATFDSSGMRPMELTLWVVTFASIKKTLSRLLLLVVSMDYDLGGIASSVLLLGLGVIYFVPTVALALVEHLGNINDFPGKTMISSVIPVALLDACFILWVFSSLARTLEKLQIKRNMAKLEHYKNITNALAIYVMLSIAWIGFEVYFYASDTMSKLRMAWIIPAGWNLLFYGLLAVQCVIWAPGKLGQVYDRQTKKMQEAEREYLVQNDVVEAQLEDRREFPVCNVVFYAWIRRDKVHLSYSLGFF
ncbi:hypothetical protein V5N11_016661 [Cardamine amara subsp. amara]|uniref:GOST seven transmembrane domain-containing protein n=1 Tax=Cardamine amara subsp. amara TaxID=228776 RepID=A0ABD0ZGD7_CARAN